MKKIKALGKKIIDIVKKPVDFIRKHKPAKYHTIGRIKNEKIDEEN